jgi:hypothetical protein
MDYINTKISSTAAAFISVSKFMFVTKHNFSALQYIEIMFTLIANFSSAFRIVVCGEKKRRVLPVCREKRNPEIH